MKTKATQKRGRKIMPLHERKVQYISYIRYQDREYLQQKFGSATNAMIHLVKMLKAVEPPQVHHQ